MKRTPDERHIYTHGNFNNMLLQSQMHFSISGALYTVFSHTSSSLLIEKGIWDCRNLSVKLPFVYVYAFHPEMSSFFRYELPLSFS